MKKWIKKHENALEHWMFISAILTPVFVGVMFFVPANDLWRGIFGLLSLQFIIPMFLILGSD